MKCRSGILFVQSERWKRRLEEAQLLAIGAAEEMGKIKNRLLTDCLCQKTKKLSPRYHFFYRIIRSLSPVVRSAC